MRKTVAIYPGSFDPMTNGHLDIIQRGAKLFDEVIVAVLVNSEKAPLFAAEERVEMMRAILKENGLTVRVDTFGGLLVTYAHCCYPLPGDPILAFLSTGRGIVIHRETCGNVTDYRKHPENWLPVNWKATEGRFFFTEIRVEAVNRMGLLAAVSAAISGTQTNICSVNFQHDESETATMVFMLEVHDREHLARIMRTVRRMSDVVRIVRTIAGQHRRRDPLSQ